MTTRREAESDDEEAAAIAMWVAQTDEYTTSLKRSPAGWGAWDESDKMKWRKLASVALHRTRLRNNEADERLSDLINDIGTGHGVSGLRAAALKIKHVLRGLTD